MYFLSPDYLNDNAKHPPPPPLFSKEFRIPGTAPLQKKRSNKKSKRVVKKKGTTKRSIGKLIKLRAKLREADLERKREIKTIANFVKKLLHTSTFEQKVLPESNSGTQTIRRCLPKTPLLHEAPQIDLKASPTTSAVKYETTTPLGTIKRGDAADGEEDNKEVLEFGELASPYISPYVYKRGFLDTTYGIL
jgi:hypothetical protein